MEYVSANGVEMPALGLGTAGMTGWTCRHAVETALDLGYRHVDTAQMYGNENDVGDTIAAADVDRDDVFLVTKVLRRNLGYDDLLPSVEGSLDRLGTDYVDLLLIHGPSRSVPVEESLRAMNELRDRGAVRHLGVSNFGVPKLREAIAASDAPIVADQVEYNPYHDRSDLLPFCIENDVVLAAYTPIAKGKVVGNRTLSEIGERHGKTEVQVALRWLLQQRNVAAIPKSADEEHLRENIDVFDFELTDEEMERVFDVQDGLADRLRSLIGL